MSGNLLDIALEAAREAAALHRDHLGSLPEDRWSEKASSDYVTEVDRTAERAIVERIAAAYPAHSFLAEEGTATSQGGAGARPGPGSDEGESAAAITWIIDPLDGTTNWLHGYPEFAVSIAALDAGGLRLGVVINSSTREEFRAERGGGAWLDDRPLHVSGLSDERHALIGTGFPFKHLDLLPGYLEGLGRVLRNTSGVRRGGSAALDLCDVAAGRLDGFWECWLMPWDVAAGALMVREAGGRFAPLDAGTSGEAAYEAARRFVERTTGETSAPLCPEAGAYVAGSPRMVERLADLVTDPAQAAVRESSRPG